jgi:hypothetical protein
VELELLGELLFDATAAKHRAETQAKTSGPTHRGFLGSARFDY